MKHTWRHVMASLSDDISMIDRNCTTLSRFAELSLFI